MKKAIMLFLLLGLSLMLLLSGCGGGGGGSDDPSPYQGTWEGKSIIATPIGDRGYEASLYVTIYKDGDMDCKTESVDSTITASGKMKNDGSFSLSGSDGENKGTITGSVRYEDDNKTDLIGDYTLKSGDYTETGAWNLTKVE